MSPFTDPRQTMPELVISTERRQTERHDCHLKSSCAPVENPCNATPWPATIKDISRKGIRLGLFRRFEPGTLLTIGLIGVNGDSRLLLGRVVRLASQEERRWILGCSLATVLEEAELRELIDYSNMGQIRIGRAA